MRTRRRSGRYGPSSRACTCGLELALDAGTGPDLLAYVVLLGALASAVRRCGVPVPEGLWAAAEEVARWEAAHRGLLGLLGLLEGVVATGSSRPGQGGIVFSGGKRGAVLAVRAQHDYNISAGRLRP